MLQPIQPVDIDEVAALEERVVVFAGAALQARARCANIGAVQAACDRYDWCANQFGIAAWCAQKLKSWVGAWACVARGLQPAVRLAAMFWARGCKDWVVRGFARGVRAWYQGQRWGRTWR
eukprot:12030523-Alexandrium_andersonii.AAC.1